MFGHPEPFWFPNYQYCEVINPAMMKVKVINTWENSRGMGRRNVLCKLLTVVKGQWFLRKKGEIRMSRARWRCHSNLLVRKWRCVNGLCCNVLSVSSHAHFMLLLMTFWWYEKQVKLKLWYYSILFCFF